MDFGLTATSGCYFYSLDHMAPSGAGSPPLIIPTIDTSGVTRFNILRRSVHACGKPFGGQLLPHQQ